MQRSDVPAVAALHIEVFGPPNPETLPFPDLGYEQMLFEHPSRRPDDPAGLVYESKGRVVGSSSLLTQRMRHGDRELRVLVPTKFVVSRIAGSGLVAAQLARAVVNVPHDLLIADNGTEAMVPLWRRVGGFLVPMASLSWVRPFRPVATVARGVAGRGGAVGIAAAMAGPGIRALDWALAKKGWNRFDGGDVTVEPVATLEELVPVMNAAAEKHALHPVYDTEAFAWQMSVLRTMAGPQRELVGLRMRGRDTDALGWAICYETRGGPVEVLQLGATQAEVPRTMVHALMDYMAQRGASSIGGRLSVPLLHALAGDRATTGIGTPWCLAHTSDPRIRAALSSGDFFYSRLEGEWW